MPLTPNNETLRLDAENQKDTIKKASKRFHKSFKEQFVEINAICEVGRFVFPIFSVCLGVFFIAYFIENTLPFIYACFALALIFLIFIELSKYYLIKTTLEVYFSGKGLMKWLIISSVLVHCASIFLSVYGSKELYEKTDRKTVNLEAKFNREKDSLNYQFDSRVSIIQSEIDSLKRSKKVTDWNFELIRSGNENVQTLENTRRLQLSELKTEHEKVKSVFIQKSGFNIIFMIVLALFIEILIIVCNVFILYYDYKIEKTKEILLQDTGILECNNLQKQFSDLQTYLSVFANVHGAIQAPQKSLNKSANEIGFKIAQPVDKSSTYADKLNNHFELVSVLLQPQICENENISNATYRDIIRPQIEHLNSKSDALCRNLFNIIKTVGVENISIENNQIIIRK